jgi:hypothetical protein
MKKLTTKYFNLSLLVIISFYSNLSEAIVLSQEDTSLLQQIEDYSSQIESIKETVNGELFSRNLIPIAPISPNLVAQFEWLKSPSLITIPDHLKWLNLSLDLRRAKMKSLELGTTLQVMSDGLSTFHLISKPAELSPEIEILSIDQRRAIVDQHCNDSEVHRDLIRVLLDLNKVAIEKSRLLSQRLGQAFSNPQLLMVSNEEQDKLETTFLFMQLMQSVLTEYVYLMIGYFSIF